MAVSNVTPSIQYTGNGSTTNFGFNFVVPALQTGNTITDSTASITSGSTTLTVTTTDFFYTSDLQGKAITVTGAGVSSADLTTTILTVTSGTEVELTTAASTNVSNATVTVTTGKFGTAMKNTGDLEVYVDGTLKTYTTDYTVLLNVGDDSNKGGTVIFNSAPAGGSSVTIIRDVELSRTVDFQTGGALTARDLNAEFDSIVMALQDNIEVASKNALKFPADELVTTEESTLPSSTNRQNKLLAFDGSGVLKVTADITSGEGNVTANVVNANSAVITTVTGNLVGNVTGDVTGTVTDISNHTTSELPEGSNLYFTTIRTRQTLSVGPELTPSGNGGISYLTGSGVFQYTPPVLSGLTGDTGDITEGTNLYYTDARADARISVASVGDLSDVITTGLSSSSGQGNVLAWDETNQRFEPTPTSIAVSAVDPLSYNSGTGQFSLLADGIDATHIDFGTGVNQVNTDDLPEGSTNLYFTNERVDDRINGLFVAGAGLNKTYDDNANTYTLDLSGTTAEFDTALTDDNFVTETKTQTLTNKTLTSATLNSADIDLGTDLDVKDRSIVSSTGDIQLVPYNTSKVKIDNNYWPNADGNVDQLLKTDGAGNLSWATIGTGGLGNLSEDLTPQLGADLDVNNHSIVSVLDRHIELTPNGIGKTKITGAQFQSTVDIFGQAITDSTSSEVRLDENLRFGSSSSHIISDYNYVTEFRGRYSGTDYTRLRLTSGDPDANNWIEVVSKNNAAPVIKSDSTVNADADLELQTQGNGNIILDSTANVSANLNVTSNVSVGTHLTTPSAEITKIINDNIIISPQNDTDIPTGYGSGPVIKQHTDEYVGLLFESQSARNDDGSGNRIISNTGYDVDARNRIHFLRSGADNANGDVVNDSVLGNITASGMVNGGYGNGDAAISFLSAEDFSYSDDGLGNKTTKSGTKIEFEATPTDITTTWTTGGVGQFRETILTIHGDKIEAHKPTQIKNYPGLGSFPTASSDNKGALVYDSANNGLYISNGSSWVTAGSGIGNLVEDTTPQLGGALDVNGQSITSTSNGNIVLAPNGDGQIDLDSYVWPKNGLGSVDQVLKINTIAGGVAQLAWTSSMSNLVEDTTPQLGGALDVNGQNITSASGAITIAPNSGADTKIRSNVVQLGQTNTATKITTNGTGDLTLDTNDSTDTGEIVILAGANQNIEITPNGTGLVVIGGDLDVNGQDITSTSNGAINIQPDGTGKVDLGNAGAAGYSGSRPEGAVRIYDRGGLTVGGADYADTSFFVRNGTDPNAYCLEVQHNAGSTGLVAGNAGGSFGFAAYADSTNSAGSVGYVYTGAITSLIGAGGNLSNGSGADFQHGIRLNIYPNGITSGFTAENAATFRTKSIDFMKETLKFNYASNTVTIEAPTSNDNIEIKTNGSTGYIILSNLPTSATGLPSGALWKDTANGNVLKVV